MSTLPPLSGAPKTALRTRLLHIAVPILAVTIAAGGLIATAPSVRAEARTLVPVTVMRTLVVAQPGTPGLHPAPAAVPAPAALPELPTLAPSTAWSIDITAFGWQDELDACQWVYMDMVAEVTIPIVAAHNSCGGGIVLDMSAGDTVTLAGEGLDGTYVVTTDKLAWAGQEAVDAIAGLSADVILQTCYWANDGSERLIALTRIG